MNKQIFVQKIVHILKDVLPKDRGFIGLHEPQFYGNEWNYLKECIDSGWVSSVGKYVDQFERQLADFTGVAEAVAVVNGTAALHIALLLAGVEPNDEVLIPALSFVATANAVAYCGAVPHFVDVEEATLGMDAGKLDAYLQDIGIVKSGELFNKKTNRRIRAVIPMHTFGHPVDMDPLLEVSGKHRLSLIEDAAESLGSYYKGSHTGSMGKISAISFNGNKIITTGGGGAVLTNNSALAKMAKHLTTTAKVPHKWSFFHDQVGYNYRLPNINAALGCAQLEQLPSFLEKKRELARTYLEAFEPVEGVRVFKERDFAKSNYWLNTLVLDRELSDIREDLLEETDQQGIMTRPSWTLLYKLPMYADCPKMDMTVSEDLDKRLINIPSSVF